MFQPSRDWKAISARIPVRRDESKQGLNGTMRHISVLGSTGSIGRQTLAIVREAPDRLKVRALTAGRNVSLLIEQAKEFRPDLVVIGDEARVNDIVLALEGLSVEVLSGTDALDTAATYPGVDTVVTAVVGSVGLRPTLAAVEAGLRIALANKETLVVAGELIMPRVRAGKAEIIPVDSEHSAIFQCLVGEPAARIDYLTLTASGGPFRERDPGTFSGITAEEALHHPTWDMGAKITIDSATLMNKGLEVIEAKWLFDLRPDQIRVVVHPQSIIHSMVTFSDGSVKAQLGAPDMRLPIQYALSYPDRWPIRHTDMDWSAAGPLEFRPPDEHAFPCLSLARRAMEEGGCMPAVLNAANEEAVSLFLSGDLSFPDVPAVIEKAMKEYADVYGSGNVDSDQHAATGPAISDSDESKSKRNRITLELLEAADQFAREFVMELGEAGSH